MRLSPLLRALVQFVVCSSMLLKNVAKSPLRAQGEWSPLAEGSCSGAEERCAVCRLFRLLKNMVKSLNVHKVSGRPC